MMPLRTITFVLLGLCALPSAVSAGPIEFELGPGNLTFSNPNPGADVALVPFRPPGVNYFFDPATGTPVGIELLRFDPSRLPDVPAWATTFPDGTVSWNVNGFFGLPITLIDVASGDSATINFLGAAHMIANFSPTSGWTGSATFTSQFWQQVRLGDNLYSVWGPPAPNPGAAVVDVWVGDGKPPIPQFTPEPGTMVLVALGLVPFGLCRWWRT
jgi:hypothetical protein